MNNELDIKWKRFSVDLHFSSYDESVTPEAVFDILTACTSVDEWNHDIADMDIVVWHPFEDMHWEALRRNVQSAAEVAQRYAEIR